MININDEIMNMIETLFYWTAYSALFEIKSERLVNACPHPTPFIIQLYITYIDYHITTCLTKQSPYVLTSPITTPVITNVVSELTHSTVISKLSSSPEKIHNHS